MGALIGWFVGKTIFGKTISEPVGKFLAWLTLIVSVGALILGGIKLHDLGVISKHDAKVEAKTAKADKTADNHAGVQRRVDDARLTQEAEELRKAQANAKSNHDRSLARARCIRLQQSARSQRKQPPSCDGLGMPVGAGGAH